MTLDGPAIIGTALFSVGATHLKDEHEKAGGSYVETAKAAPLTTAVTLVGAALLADMIYHYVKNR